MAAVAALPVLLAAAVLRGHAAVDPERVYLVVALMHYVQRIVAVAVRSHRS
ncbi:hypothetical protein [Kitasatospora sp. NPDC050463]|uniref:hypothetical protein n=1 Tax=Kitasatospora sp. NPDC050463 TaxID=3155786 RepID=UPI0034031CE4